MYLHELSKERLSFLVVDQSAAVRQLLEAMLVPVKNRIILADNMADAYEYARTLWPDVIIADYAIDASGARFCEQVRTDPMLSHTPFILMSAFANQVSPVKYLESGCDQVVYKPFKCADMYAAIRSSIQHTVVKGRGNMIPVLYKAGHCDYVSPEHLDKMIQTKEILCFRRSEGVVIIGRYPVRITGSGKYTGPERRWAAA